MTVTECAKLLGEAIAKDEAVLAFNAAKKTYEENEAITKAINEYNAQRMVNALMQSVNSDINFYAFGERPCTHDCSSCSSNCSSRG